VNAENGFAGGNHSGMTYGNVAFSPITTFRCAAGFGRYRGNSGHWPAKRPEYLWVHGLIEISCFSATDTELSTLSQNALRLHEGSGEF
jgi:hypothetical protein